MGKKPFINRKTAKHYHVVHRSQKDPLINDSEASDRVLQEVLPSNQLKHKTQEEIDRVKAKPKKLTQDEIDQRIGQAAMYGIFFDDGEYDYLQHLKPIGGSTDAVFLEAPKKEKPKTIHDAFLKEEDEYREQKNSKLIQLPSDVLPSSVEMAVGVMNQSTGLDNGLQPDMDPRLREVLEALSDDEFIDDELGDDFIEQLNADGEPYDPEEDDDYFDSEVEEYEEYEEYDNEEQQQEEGEVNAENYDWEAAFKKFKLSQNRNAGSDDESDKFDRYTKQTGYSVSSSAMHRNTQLRLLDDRFEKIEEEYMEDEDESEEMNEEEIQQREDFESILDDFLEKYEIIGRKMEPKMEGESSAAKLDSYRQGLIKPDVQQLEEQHEPSKPRLTRALLEPRLERPVQRQKESWDVQTIISTYSNLENHPSLISDKGPSKKIRIDPKTGMPILVEVERKQKKKQVEEEENSEEEEEDDDDENISAENRGVARLKGETKEEKKARKQAVKEAKKVIIIIKRECVCVCFYK
ncbi:Low temperature viability protein-domain-containing protein [Cokeromyces recurvatus]|uniref:Low temperature viability protein-domain-containing protein n=1 Tax=Cokeromyces recurvatus TaxID=90255 RepID=UPI0022202BA7|nr:Low temperature viability protein-domain-containing protein [Cokeromyces recurvatus]KAI7901719.1 Low temperature viability protein-domain-containing protein [Cokeromyces recurvatus]